MFLFFLLLVAAALFLARSGKFGPPPWVSARHSPETEAKRVLAERFARGDISSDDFLERASVLNWTPGSESWEHQKKKRR
jgi:putative membrane protein